MKYLLAISIAIIFCTNCKKDIPPEPDEPIYKNVAGTHLDVNDIIELLPEELFNNKKAVFTNDVGDEWIFDLIFIIENRDRSVSGQHYSYDQFVVRYFDEEVPNLSLGLYAYALYSSKYDIQKSIRGDLMPFNPGGKSSSRIEFINGKLTAIFSKFDKERIINGIVYSNTFTSRNDYQTFDSYSELVISTDFGVVAFRDANDLMWSFVRFE